MKNQFWILIYLICSSCYVKYAEGLYQNTINFKNNLEQESNYVDSGKPSQGQVKLNDIYSSYFMEEYNFSKGYFKATLSVNSYKIVGTNNYGTTVRPKNWLMASNNVKKDKQYIYIIILDNSRMFYYSPYESFRGDYTEFYTLEPNNTIELQEINKCYKKSNSQIRGYYEFTYFNSDNFKQYLNFKKKLKSRQDSTLLQYCKAYDISNHMLGDLSFYGNPKNKEIKRFQFYFYIDSLLNQPDVPPQECLKLYRISEILKSSNINSTFEHYDLDTLGETNLLKFEFIPHPLKINYKNNIINEIKCNLTSKEYQIISATESTTYPESDYCKLLGFN